MQKKIRIAAIAKDEGAYLAQWIFHHFHFGFDSIDIYINQTTDNSQEICSKLSRNFNVRVQDGDALVRSHGANFQKAAYEHAYEMALKEEVSHLLFIDIDEFWTPLDFTTTVHEHLENHENSDVLCYEWGVPANDNISFSSPFSTNQKILKNYHLKCLFNTKINIKEIGIHNVVSETAKYVLADGTTPHFDSASKATIRIKDTTGPMKDVFILHRLSRSEIEYVSLLGKGRPSTKNKLKNNRWGFIDSNSGLSFDIPHKILDKYNKDFQDLLNVLDLERDINESIWFVLERFKKVIDIVYNSDSSDIETHEKLLTNVKLLSVVTALKEANSNHKQDISHLINEDLLTVPHYKNSL